MRDKNVEARLVASGASRTMNSRHLTGHAVDLAPRVAEPLLAGTHHAGRASTRITVAARGSTYAGMPAGRVL